LINLYRPPGENKKFWELLEEHLTQIKDKHKKRDIIMVGDFSIDLQLESMNSNRLIGKTLEFSLIQKITADTRITATHRSLIDHVYIKSKGDFSSKIITTDLSDNFVTLTTKNNTRVPKQKTNITKRWFTKQSYEHLQSLLGAEDWTQMNNLTADQAADYLERRITEHSDLVAPVLTKQIKVKKINQWTTQDIRTSLLDCSTLYKSAKKAKEKKLIDERIKTYKAYRKLLDKVTRAADH
jgi:hypothetical protein